MITTSITSGNGEDNRLKVLDEGEIGVVIHTHPPIRESRKGLPFRQYFTDDGTSSGGNDMRVNGATTNVDYYISASSEYEYFIKFISIKLADATAKLNEFGALTALTNGLEFIWESQSLGSLGLSIDHNSVPSTHPEILVSCRNFSYTRLPSRQVTKKKPLNRRDLITLVNNSCNLLAVLK